MSMKKLPWEINRGVPLPLGATVLGEGINFSLFSRNGTRVTLVLDHYNDDQVPTRFELPLHPEENRTGDVWHILLETNDTNLQYGYKIDGLSNSGLAEKTFDPQQILIDPYSHSLAPRKWGKISSYGNSPCCRIITHDFDWQNDRPLKTPLNQTVIYELHVRGFTKGDPKVTAPGTYQGVIEKIPYLQQLGITAVELMPVTEFDENDNLFFHPQSGKRLKNFWGYNPVSFFALKSGYAKNPDNHINEFKAMVLALHQAGIEVILDMVYNHTGEGGYDQTTSSFRGIDNDIYYMLSPEAEYLNYTGCGNTLNCNHPVVRSLIRDSLQYWVMEMHVDGFRFDLASILGRDTDGNPLANPPMIEMIAEDPVLRDTKIIAEAWDAAGLYQVGSFSTNARWVEWNGKFRDDVRRFMAGEKGMITKVATRIAGSSDLYQTSSRSPLNSINFITSHDGFTLYDLVSYNTKHNLANGEDNRDGDNHNFSWNSGYEGTPAAYSIEQLRQRRIRSMFTILMISQGVPMITAGDEFGRTQQGNNNSYCQDNPTSWINWALLTENTGLLRFFRQVIELRRRYSLFRRESFFETPNGAEGNEHHAEISWQYLYPGEQDWSDSCQGLGVLLHANNSIHPDEDDFFIMINGSKEDSLEFTPPKVPNNHLNKQWHQIIDSSAPSPADINLQGSSLARKRPLTMTLPPFTVIVLQSKPVMTVRHL